MGCVEEPYLEGTPDIMMFLVRFMYGAFSFGEAAVACQSSLSWQTTVVGDPLYRPFAKNPLELHAELSRRNSKLIEWSHLKVVDMNLAIGTPLEKVADYLETTQETYTSAVLLEKLGDIYFMKAKWPEAAQNYRKALLHSPSPQQQVRLFLSLIRNLELAGEEQEVMKVSQEFIKACPDYPDLLTIHRKLALLFARFGKPEDKDRNEREIQRLSPESVPKP